MLVLSGNLDATALKNYDERLRVKSVSGPTPPRRRSSRNDAVEEEMPAMDEGDEMEVRLHCIN